jgi:predicted nucleotidyltransferase component of viral defense system
LKYGSAQAFEAALSSALRRRVRGDTNAEFQRLRRSVAFDRLLARLNQIDSENWLLKGGVALEYRMPVEARATTDIDLSARVSVDIFVKSLTDATSTNLGDYFEFVFTREPFRPVADLPTTYRFSIEARLNARRFERLTLDVGFADPWLGIPEQLTASDLLGFAGIDPITVRAIPIVQHVAEKVHAYTRQYGRENTRVKDLVDIVLLASHRPIDGVRLRTTLDGVFEARGTHVLPTGLPMPPPGWAGPYEVLTEPLGIEHDLARAHAIAADFLDPVLAEPVPIQGRMWDPASLSWTSGLPSSQRDVSVRDRT